MLTPELIKDLKDLAYRRHYYCEDPWYSCPKAPEGCANDAYEEDECTCGADLHNQEVDRKFRQLQYLL